MSATDDGHPADQLISNPRETYGERFQEDLLEQYKLYVDSAQKVSEKRISTGNYLLTVCSTLLTVFGIAATLRVLGAWHVVIPIAGFLVSVTWFSLVMSYRDLNTAKFKVIHELENYLPAGLFRYEWHTCEHGRGKAYKPITHLERWIPLIFAVVYLVLGAYTVFPHPSSEKQPEVRPVSVTGAVDVNIKSGAPVRSQGQPATAPPDQPRKTSRQKP
jgi:hypothetical protein